MGKTFLDEIKAAVVPLLDKQEIELVELIFNKYQGRGLLRFLVDKPGGVTLGACAKLNREIGCVLDEANLLQQAYVLEVSSPGLDRFFSNTRDYQRNIGKKIMIILHQPLNKQNVWIGTLKQADAKNVAIITGDAQEIQLARNNIAKARLEV